MTVDVVIRTKNRPRFLARALQDVAAQEFTDRQVIVVNDGGEPGPVDDLVAQHPRVEVLHLPESVGIGAAANRGVEAGSGEFIALHDDDDTWHPAFLARTMAHLQSSDDLAVATRTEIVLEDVIGGRFVETGREVLHPMMIEPTYFDLLRFNHLAPIGLLFRRTAYEEYGPLSEDYAVLEDWMLNLEIARTGRLGWIDEILAYWHQRPNARGADGNTVHAGLDLHIRDERRFRDARLRAYVAEHGEGALLYLAKFIDERVGELHARFDRVEAQQEEILRALREQPPSTVDRLRNRLRG